MIPRMRSLRVKNRTVRETPAVVSVGRSLGVRRLSVRIVEDRCGVCEMKPKKSFVTIGLNFGGGTWKCL